MERMMIFIDAGNVKPSKNNSIKLDYKSIINHFGKKFRIIRTYYYDGSPHFSEWSKGRKNFYNMLREIGVTLRLKELSKKYPTQKGIDIYLTSDMISLAYENAYDVAVIVSGDGDYKALVELVKSKGKIVWVLSFKEALSYHLKECADKIIIIDEMPETFSQKIETIK